jgi:hypothetical protein
MDIYKHKGNFVDRDYEAVEQTAAPTDAFPILCGAWPNDHIGARQVKCFGCGCFQGISPKGWQLHQQNPESRPLFCEACFLDFVKTLDSLIEELQHRKPSA